MKQQLNNLSFLSSGSHNAITYCLDMNDRSVDPMQPDMLQKLDKYMKPLIRPFVYKWAITQVITLDSSTLWELRFNGRRTAVMSCASCVFLGVHYKAAAGLRGQILRPEDRTQTQRPLHRPVLLPRCLHHAHRRGKATVKAHRFVVEYFTPPVQTLLTAYTLNNSRGVLSLSLKIHRQGKQRGS